MPDKDPTTWAAGTWILAIYIHQDSGGALNIDRTQSSCSVVKVS
jgi:hypothetical protein